MRLIDPNTGAEMGRIANTHPVKWVQISPDGRFLATMSEEKTPDNQFEHVGRLLAAHSGDVLAAFAISGREEDAVFSPDSRFLAAATSENELRLFAAESGSELFRLNVPGQQARVANITFSVDSRFVAYVAEKVETAFRRGRCTSFPPHRGTS